MSTEAYFGSSAERGQATATVVAHQPLNQPRAPPPERTPWPHIGLIILSFCCCTILGRYAYYETEKAKTAYQKGRYSEAEAHGQKARRQVWIAIGVGSTITVVGLAVIGIVVYLQIANNDSI